MSIRTYISEGVMALGLATAISGCGGCAYQEFSKENPMPQAAQEARLLNIRRQVIQNEMRHAPISTNEYFIEDRERMETLLRTEANKRHEEAGKVELVELEARIQTYEGNPEIVAHEAKEGQHVSSQLKFCGMVLGGVGLIALGTKLLEMAERD